MHRSLWRLPFAVVAALVTFLLLAQGALGTWRIVPGSTPLGDSVGIDDQVQVCRDGAVFHAALLDGSPDDYSNLPAFLSVDQPIVFASPLPPLIPTASPPTYEDPAPDTILAQLTGFTLPEQPIDTSVPPDGVTDFVYSGDTWVRWSTVLDIGAQVLMRLRLEPGPWPPTIDMVYTVADCRASVPIDIQPGNSSNTVLVSRGGIVTVAILSVPGFDAASVDPASVCFGPPLGIGDCSARQAHGFLKDIDHDGDVDMLLSFRSAQTGLTQTSSQGCISGMTFGGFQFHGCDTVRVIVRPHS